MFSGKKIHEASSNAPARSEQLHGEERRPMRGLRMLKYGLLAIFVVIALRLAQVQILDSAKYRQIAEQQAQDTIPLIAARGKILDRNGNILASHSLFVTLAADPKVAETCAVQIAAELSRTFGRPKEFYLSRLRCGKRFVRLERRVHPEHVAGFRAQSFRGIFEIDEPTRLYHYDEMSGALLGLVDEEREWTCGVELQFDQDLRGKDGYSVVRRDAKGRTNPTVDCPRVESSSGNDVYLTIDLTYQSIAEQKLKEGIERTQAEAGLMVVMNPKTGEILAVAQCPAFNPNVASASGMESRRARAFTDTFEPGSVFKLVTAAAALESHVVRPDQKFYAEHGEYHVRLPHGKQRIIRDTHPYDTLTFQQAMEVSSNIVMAKVSDRVGVERLYTRARDLGFGNKTGVEYPSESRGDLKRPTQWSGVTLNSMAYGYEVGVTPIQIAAAYSAVANGGVLVKPTLLKRIKTPAGTTIREQAPQSLRRVISPQTAATLTQFFEGVVQRGTATAAQVEGMRVAGKTGTSRKLTDGKYKTSEHTASFVGYFPAEDPQILCLVMLDNPKVGGYTGGATAAPIVKEFAQHVITAGRLTVAARSTAQPVPRSSDQVTVPDVCNLHTTSAKKMLEARGLVAQSTGEGLVRQQTPAASSIVLAGTTVTLVADSQRGDFPAEGVLVPDVRKMSARRAANRLAMDSLQPVIQGSGIVVDQSPQPGEHVQAGAAIVLSCEPHAVVVRNR